MCEVCCEKFNKSNHSQVVCPYCPYECGSSCYEKYLLDTPEDAHCMSCRKGWSREILVGNFTQKFVSRTYKGRREDLLFEREKSMMPATQPYVEITRQIRKLRENIQKIKVKIDNGNQKMYVIARQDLTVLRRDNSLETVFDAMVFRNKLICEQRKTISVYMIDVQHLEWHEGQLNIQLSGNSIERENRQFVRACPFGDCRGFLSQAWKCGMCDNWTCPRCHEVKGLNKDEPHECNPDSLATAELLAKDSRNCPKCAAMIFKINGCDQMYCTQCHTAFSWRTGRIEQGVIHNPHYYEYQRAMGTLARAPGDLPCGGFPDWRAIVPLLAPFSGTPILRVHIENAHRSHGHCQWVMMGRYIVNQQADNRDLRINFMIGDSNEEEFKKKIQQREKSRQRKTDISQVLEMYMAVLVDLFQAFMVSRDANVLMNCLNELRSHVNETLSKVSKRYSHCAIPKIDERFNLH